MNKQSGFTLIEVLIAMLVLAIGLLGLAGLQAKSLSYTQSAYNRSLATELAYDLADRMRANISGIATYTAESSAQNANCENTSGCSSSQMAQNDLYEWNFAVTNTLLSGLGTIAPVGGMCNIVVCTITINWDDNRDGVVDTKDPNFTTSFQL
jgi:type IV pilus assembly protein PilV